MSFNEIREADKLEQLAKTRLDTTDDKAGAANKALCDEWASLNQKQRDNVSSVLCARRYDNGGTLPLPSKEYDINGHVVGIMFTAGTMDFKDGPHEINLLAHTGAHGKEDIDVTTNTERYDPGETEAKKIAALAEKRIDTPSGPEADALNKALAKEWLSLSPDARALVAQRLDDDAYQVIGVPEVEVVLDNHYHVTGVDFSSSMFDFRPGPSCIQINTVTTDKGEVVTTRFEDHNTNGLQRDFALGESQAAINQYKQDLADDAKGH